MTAKNVNLKLQNTHTQPSTKPSSRSTNRERYELPDVNIKTKRAIISFVQLRFDRFFFVSYKRIVLRVGVRSRVLTFSLFAPKPRRVPNPRLFIVGETFCEIWTFAFKNEYPCSHSVQCACIYKARIFSRQRTYSFLFIMSSTRNFVK